MAKFRGGGSGSSSSKKNGFIKLKIVAKKLQESLSLCKKSSSSSYDVMEGRFPVIADCDREPQRFVVPLSYLTHPMFLRLLEQAAEEYGFDHEGALTIPCHPSELERMLADQQWEGEAASRVDDHINWVQNHGTKQLNIYDFIFHVYPNKFLPA